MGVFARQRQPGPRKPHVFRLMPSAPAASTWAQGSLAGSLGETVTTTRALAKWVPNGSGIASVSSGNPAVGPKGLLVESSAVNRIIRSGAISNAAWTKDGVTEGTGVAGPDGSTASSLITASAGLGEHRVYSTLYSPSAAVHTMSIYAKAGTVSWLRLGWNSAGVDSVTFNLSTGTIGSETGASTGRIESVGNGWYRCSMTWTATATANYIVFRIGTTEGNTSFFAPWTALGTETGYVWGAQFELGSFASSWIETAGAAVTRPADVVTVPTTGWPTAAGSVSFEFTPNWSTAPSSNPVLFSTTGTNAGLRIYVSGTDFMAEATKGDGSTVAVTAGSTTWAAGTTYRVRAEWSASGLHLYRNEVRVATSASAANLAAHAANASIGCSAAGAAQADGFISNLAIRK